MMYVGGVVIWTILAVIGVNYCHRMINRKRWHTVPKQFWYALLFTVFLPWTVLAFGLFAITVYTTKRSDKVVERDDVL